MAARTILESERRTGRAVFAETKPEWSRTDQGGAFTLPRPLPRDLPRPDQSGLSCWARLMPACSQNSPTKVGPWRNRAALNALKKCRKTFFGSSKAVRLLMSEMTTTIEPATLGLHSLESYEPLIGAELVDRILRKMRNVRDLHVIHVSSTFYGGGVTELLTPLTLIMNAHGMETGWRMIQGTPAFFNFTKKLHNTLQGEPVDLTPEEIDLYEQVTLENATRLHIEDCDAVVVHDPQPLALISHFPDRDTPWLWQCHVDLSSPHAGTWTYLRKFIDQYHAAIFSLPEYRQSLANRSALHHARDQPILAEELRNVGSAEPGLPHSAPHSARSSTGGANLTL